MYLRPEEELGKCIGLGIQVMAEYEDEYPGPCRVATPPPLLSTVNLRSLEGLSIAVVGSRKATPYGKMVARKLGREFAQAGMVVVSGMARGVDAEAHRGCIEGGGMTIGILGNGIDIVYPRENGMLYNEVQKKGLLLSEFPPGTKPEPGNFPIRNRLISALSRGVVVVEAREKSGAMITVGFALEQGKDVFAVPGPISSTNSIGPQAYKGGCLPGYRSRGHFAGGVLNSEPYPMSIPLIKNQEYPLLKYIGYEPVHLDRILRCLSLLRGNSITIA